jgi:hypothetical protein
LLCSAATSADSHLKLKGEEGWDLTGELNCWSVLRRRFIFVRLRLVTNFGSGPGVPPAPAPTIFPIDRYFKNLKKFHGLKQIFMLLKPKMIIKRLFKKFV